MAWHLCNMILSFADLVQKYNLPLPRYTSYPTVPFWDTRLPDDEWKNSFQEQFEIHNSRDGISLYIHLPFCESLCTYCGCNKKITQNHSVEAGYLAALDKEWQLYLQWMNETPVIREIHLGGGTPTFFSPAHLEKLINAVFKRAVIHPDHAFSIEGHPNNTTADHLRTLYQLGFRRISYGVQDHNEEVQRIINRVQPFENVKRATNEARAAGFTSVNFDHIYGLPKQTLASIETTMLQTISLRPDRIAFYSYAHVPWTSRGQRLFDEDDLPTAEQKLQLYLKGKELLTAAGYVDIGMDHFALPNDELYTAWQNKSLHRNFMGYTTRHTAFLLGLGVSSISDTGTAFCQNEKTQAHYYQRINNGELPVTKGYLLHEEDLEFRNYILEIICNGSVNFHQKDWLTLQELTFPKLELLQQDGLLHFTEQGLTVTALGRNFVRNICSAFDLHLLRSKAENAARFSKAI